MRALLEHLLAGARPSASGWYRVNCPFCFARVGKADRKQSFGLRADSGFYHCFRCGAAGNVDGDVLRELPKQTATDGTCEALAPPEGFYALGAEPGVSAVALEPARSYLRRRGLADVLVREVGIGACLSGRYANRVVVPVLADGVRWIGFVARDWTGLAERKYLYPRGMQKGSVMFNDLALRVETDAPVFAVEGVFDAFSLWPDVVAFLGKPTEDQIAALVAARRPIVPLLDGDAHREGWALAMRLRLEGATAGSVRLPPMTDPDEVSKERLREAAFVAVGSDEGESIYQSA